MFDAQLISAAMQSREALSIFAPHVTEDDMTPPAKFWYSMIVEWYQNDGQAKSIDKTLLVAQGTQKIKNPKHRDMLLGFMSDLPEAPSPSNVAKVVLSLKRHNVGMELAAAIAGQDQKRANKLMPEYAALMAATELTKKRAEWEDAADWDKLDEIVGDDKRIRLLPLALNERTRGGALPGHHILIFGRPEMGKSTFVINMTRGFLKSGQRVLYVGNEDNINVLKRRMRCRLALMSDDEVAKDMQTANNLARERETENGGKLFMRHLHRGSGADLDKAVEEFEPTVLVLDQIRNMEGSSGGDKMTQKLEAVAIEHRNRLSRYGLVGVSVTQANDRTERYGQEPPDWLTMSDVDSSRTGLPSQADLMIGIGGKSETVQRGQRAISICKNKLSSAENSKQGFMVDYDLHRSVVK